MFPVLDVSGWPRLSTEQMGTKPKFWCQDPAGNSVLFKQSRALAGEHWSEKVAAEIAELLGLPHAAIELAVCDGKNGTVSASFLPDRPGAALVHGNELLVVQDPTYPRAGPNFQLAQHTLDRIFGAMEHYRVRLPAGITVAPGVTTSSELFVGYLVLDALIQNTDRHHENWAVIGQINPGQTVTMELAPTFDHASSLGREVIDRKREAKLIAEWSRRDPRRPARRDQTVVGYLEKDEGRSRIYARENDLKPLHPMEVFAAAYNQFPRAGEAWLVRLQSLNTDDFKAIIDQVPSELMTTQARDFALTLLDLNHKALTSRTFRYA